MYTIRFSSLFASSFEARAIRLRRRARSKTRGTNAWNEARARHDARAESTVIALKNGYGAVTHRPERADPRRDLSFSS